MGDLIVKIHKSTDRRMVVAVCDRNIIGKVFEKGKTQLDLRKDFYKGEEMSEDELLQKIRGKECSLNIVGKKAVEFAVKKDLINIDNVGEIAGIPYTQVVLS